MTLSIQDNVAIILKHQFRRINVYHAINTIIMNLVLPKSILRHDGGGTQPIIVISAMVPKYWLVVSLSWYVCTGIPGSAPTAVAVVFIDDQIAIILERKV